MQMATVRAGMITAPTPSSDARTARSPHGDVTRRGPCPRARPHPRRRSRHTRRGCGRDRCRSGRRARRIRRARAAARVARRRARRDPQGHRRRLATPSPAGGHHRPVDRAAPLREHRRERQVQPHRRRARGRARCSRSTSTRVRRSSRLPTSGSSPTGATRCPCSSTNCGRRWARPARRRRAKTLPAPRARSLGSGR